MSDDRRPKILLSLDGGGTKGLSQIEILYDVIKHLKERNGLIGTGQMLREEDVFPCDYFVSKDFGLASLSYKINRISSWEVELVGSMLF